MHTVLIGLQGVGKTTFAKTLAKKMHMLHIDTDLLLCKKFSSTSCRALFQKLGPDAFREAEKELILSLSPVSRSIISVGGGAIVMQEVREKLKHLGTVLYLSVEKKTIYDNPERFLSGAFLQGVNFDSLYDERTRLYESIADCEYKIEELYGK